MKGAKDKQHLPAVWKLACARTRALLRDRRLEAFFPQHSTPAPKISVIIPAHNEEAYIRETLERVNRQAYPDFEVIVVANGCSDRTATVARHHCDSLVVLSKKGLGLAR